MRKLMIAVQIARRVTMLLAAAGGVLALSVSGAAAQSCAGDCSEDQAVTVDELLTCVNIALGGAELGGCPACDGNSNGTVTVDELIQAVNAALEGCGSVLAASGVCMRPGASGLVPCAPGTMISASRCDDRNTCLGVLGAATPLDARASGPDGEFSLALDASAAAGQALVVEADVEPASQTKYRYIGFGPAAAGSSRSVPRGNGAALENIVIDPVSEAAVRVVDEVGFATLTNEGVTEVAGAVRMATSGSTFAGLDAASAANTATETAQNDPVVEETIQVNKTAPVDISQEGAVVASSVFNGNEFPAALAVDGDRATSWFSNGAADGPTETFRWTGMRDDLIASVSVLSNAQHAVPSFRTFGFGSVRIQVFTAGGTPVFDTTRDLPGATDPDVEVFPNVEGRSILLSFQGHDDPACGGFSELEVVARRVVP